MRIKLDPLDILFSRLIRLQAKGVCERCGNPVGFGKLQTSHFHGRRKKSVRWNEDNACALCFSCHQYFTENPLEHVDWFRERLGGERFTLLHIQSQTINKVDKEAVRLYLEQKIKEFINATE